MPDLLPPGAYALHRGPGDPRGHLLVQGDRSQLWALEGDFDWGRPGAEATLRRAPKPTSRPRVHLGDLSKNWSGAQFYTARGPVHGASAAAGALEDLGLAPAAADAELDPGVMSLHQRGKAVGFVLTEGTRSRSRERWWWSAGAEPVDGAALTLTVVSRSRDRATLTDALADLRSKLTAPISTLWTLESRQGSLFDITR